jgi:hypothetical protein
MTNTMVGTGKDCPSKDIGTRISFTYDKDKSDSIIYGVQIFYE